MGLSSSQARLLHLTARMHQIEYKAAKLEAQKLQMANESRRVYDEYLNSLETTKIQMKKLSSDGSTDCIDVTYNILMNAGYQLSMSGATVVSQSDMDYFNDNACGNAIEFACIKSGYAVKEGDYTVLASDHNIALAFNETGLSQLLSTSKDIAEWLTNMINEGIIILQKKSGSGEYYDTSVSTDTALQEVPDE